MSLKAASSCRSESAALKPHADEPSPLSCGRIPTLNDRGFTTNLPDPISRLFIDYARRDSHEALDIGCAYGVAVKELLSAGGRVCASDMDPNHLEILRATVPPDSQARLRCVRATLPDCDFPEESFGAILCSRVLHFLDGQQVDQALVKMHSWLKTGGKIFLVVDSPYSGAARDSVVPIYKKNKAEKVRWPGFMPDFETMLPTDSGVKFATPFIHLMDPDTLSEACMLAGFLPEQVGYMRRIANMSRADDLGRDHSIVVGVKA